MTGYKVGGQQKSENSWKSTNRPFLVLWSDIWNVSYVELRIWNQVSHDHRSYERNLSNCVEKPEKVRTSTGFEPMTSQYRCDALTNWAMKPLTLGAGHLWVLMSPGRIQTPLKSWLFQASLRNCLNCVHNCDDFKSAVQYMQHFIYHFTGESLSHRRPSHPRRF